jgi:hypothetical protein
VFCLMGYMRPRELSGGRIYLLRYVRLIHVVLRPVVPDTMPYHMADSQPSLGQNMRIPCDLQYQRLSQVRYVLSAKIRSRCISVSAT